MFATTIKNNELLERLDAESFDPARHKLEKQVIYSGIDLSTLGDVVDPAASITYGIVQPGTFVPAHSGVRMIRCVDLRHSSVSTKDVLWVAEEIAHPYRRSSIKPRDVLVGIAGTLGTVGLAPIDIEPANLNQSVARIRVVDKSGCDPEWVTGFLSSRFGQAILLRRAVGSVQQHLNLADLPSVPVAMPHRVVRKYIGGKLRLSEEMQSVAVRTRALVARHFASLVQLNSETDQRRTARVTNLDIIPRLNAEYYGQKYTAVEASIRDHAEGHLLLGDLCKIVRTKNRPSAECTYFEIGHIDNSSGEFLEGTPHSHVTVPNNAQRNFEAGDIAVSTRRPNRGAIALVRETNPNNFYSVFLARLRPKDISSSNWIREFLRSPAGRLLLEQRCTWTTYPVISEDDLATIPVPIDQKNWGMIDTLCSQAFICESYSRVLVHATKMLVESLIERNVSEYELIQAQTGLEQGDDSVDRAILNRLFAGGWDAKETRPLFPDLDAYYETLRMIEREQSEVAAK